MNCEQEQQFDGHIAHLYGARGSVSWSEWNSTSGGQGYWLLGTAVGLVIIGAMMATSK